MKISTAAIALLGLPAALTAAATLPELQHDAPTSPSPAQLLPNASPPPPNALARLRTALSHLFQADPAPPCAQSSNDPYNNDLRKRAHHGPHAAAASSSSSSSAPTTTAHNQTHVPIVNTFTHHTSPSTSHRGSTTAPASITQLGVFTAGGVVWTITSAAGVEAVDGKTLVPGGAPVYIAGAEVSEKATGGNVVANGAKVRFTTFSATSTAAPSSAAAGGSSGAAGSSSAGGNGSGGHSRSSAGGAAAVVTAGVGVVVGGVMALGAMVL